MLIKPVWGSSSYSLWHLADDVHQVWGMVLVQKPWARYARTALESPITAVFLLGSLGVLLTRAATAGTPLHASETLSKHM